MPTIERSITATVAESVRDGNPDSTGNTFIRDPCLPGFAIRVFRTRSTYVIEARAGRGGRSVRHKLGVVGRLDHDEARTRAKEEIARLARGVDVVADRREVSARKRAAKSTVRDGFGLVIGRDLKVGTRDDYERSLLALGWMDRKFSSITDKDVTDAFDRLGRKAQASRVMRSLRSCWNAARVESPTIRPFPSHALKQIVKQWNKTRRRRRVIPDTLLPAWRHAVANLDNESVRDLILFVHWTGCRISEARGLKTDAVDLPARKFRFIDTKTREAGNRDDDFELPITAQLLPLLKRRVAAANDDGFLFPTYDVRKLCAATTAVVPWSWHDLRRMFISASHRLGIDDVIARTLTNHVTENDAHDGYVILSADDLRPHAQAVADYLDKLSRQRKPRSAGARGDNTAAASTKATGKR